MKKLTRKRIIIVLCATVAVCGLMVLDVVMFCTWRPRQEALFENSSTFKPPILHKLKVASYFFIPVDLLRRFNNKFYKVTEERSDQVYKRRFQNQLIPSPFLWRVATFYDDGSIDTHEPYWGRKRHGWRYEWYNNGQKAFAAYDVHGKRVGLTTRWTQNGVKWFECSFVDGMNDGYETEWNSDGTVRVRGLWKKDKMIDGTFEEQIYQLDDGTAFQAVMYYSDGRFIKIENYDGTTVSNAYYSVGNVSNPYEPYSVMDVWYFFSDGIITNAIDTYDNVVPRNQWRDDFK